MFTVQVWVLFALLCGANSNERNHIYRDREPMPIWMSTVGPDNNPQETYTYFTLPFCRGYNFFFTGSRVTLDESSQFVELESGGYDIQFKDNSASSVLCTVKLDDEKVKALTRAVENDYWYKMYLDRLPIWGKVGEQRNETFYIYAHKQFNISYNENQIIDVTLSTEREELLTPGAEIKFSYEVNWKPTTAKYIERFDKYLDPDSLLYGINWFNILKILITTVLVVGIVSFALVRTLRKDYARYNVKTNVDDDFGWKEVHGDVFRAPSSALLFSALIGTGCQLTAVLLSVFGFAILGELYFSVDVERLVAYVGSYVYMATSPINGYFGGSLYSRMSGKDWKKQILVSGLLVPVCVCPAAALVNLIVDHYSPWDSMPFEKILTITFYCIFVSLPLILVGAIVGRKINGRPNSPCIVNEVPRTIPEKKWFIEPGIIVLLGGALSFCYIVMEMHLIFTSFWAYQIYYAYVFMLFVFCILVIFIICVTVLCTYILLNAEDYRWQWTSFMTAASTSVYVFAYLFYYFFFYIPLRGMVQRIFCFGYLLLLSGGLGIICGAMGYIAVSRFVTRIYSNLKIN